MSRRCEMGQKPRDKDSFTLTSKERSRYSRKTKKKKTYQRRAMSRPALVRPQEKKDA